MVDLDNGIDGRKHDRPVVLHRSPRRIGRSGRVRNHCRTDDVPLRIQRIFSDPWRRPCALARVVAVAMEPTRFNSAG